GSSGPWATGTNKAIKWNNTGSSYTIYSGNYLNYRHNHSTISKSRLDVVQEVFGNLMDSTDGVNVAVVRFDARTSSDNNGGYFATAMLPLNDTPLPELGNKSSRQHLKDVVNSFTARGNTPLAETLYEVARFYRGEAPKFGLDTTPATSVPDCLNNGKYVSPIEYQCQKNFIVLLTDGEPTYDTSADSSIRSLPGFAAATGSSTCSGNCLDELAQYLYKVDQRTDLNDTQNVITYTVGFATDQQLLSDAASKGGGEYQTTNDAAGLTDAFTSILTQIRAVNDVFTAPAVSVNAFNRLTHRNELYFAMFRPSEYPRWVGNIKRYYLGGDPLTVRDFFGAPAVDPNTGFFKVGVKSFWTPSNDPPDGDAVDKGGAASRMPRERTVYTDDGATSGPALIRFSTENVSAGLLGVAPDIHEDIVAWVNGVDVLDEDLDGSADDARARMGDPLHTEPILVTYGGTSENPDITLFASTNAGFLHAIDTNTGVELFSYIPRDLLANLGTLYEDPPSEPHPYGLDGHVVPWVKDNNRNGIVEPADGDRVYLYASMRRGGRNIYALDVTNRSAPSFKWVIRGGQGEFAELGQTWSKPVLARVKFAGEERTVLIIGGGYDPAQDANETAAPDTMGRAIYMVDAESGDRLWWAGPDGGANDANLKLAAMQNSIPSTVRVIDVNGDGYADRFYVGDMAARLWRFDVNPTNTQANNFATGGVIAELGGTSAADNRRFYYPPDVSMAPKNAFLNIAIGSGYRAHPLDTDIHDHFFIVRDFDVFSAPKDENGNVRYTAIDMDDLYDATDNVLGEGRVGNTPTEAEREAAREILEGKRGLYLKLNRTDGAWEGEKVLAESLTMAGKVIFTTFTPVAGDATACAPGQGTGKIYTINILDATPVTEHDGQEGLTDRDRFKISLRPGILPQPKEVCTADGCALMIGTEADRELSLSRNPLKSQWWQN
ncbi:MAG: pilus assembly protein, partial [Thiohalomonadaceae bacterium]